MDLSRLPASGRRIAALVSAAAAFSAAAILIVPMEAQASAPSREVVVTDIPPGVYSVKVFTSTRESQCVSVRPGRKNRQTATGFSVTSELGLAAYWFTDSACKTKKKNSSSALLGDDITKAPRAAKGPGTLLFTLEEHKVKIFSV